MEGQPPPVILLFLVFSVIHSIASCSVVVSYVVQFLSMQSTFTFLHEVFEQYEMTKLDLILENGIDSGVNLISNFWNKVECLEVLHKLLRLGSPNDHR